MGHQQFHFVSYITHDADIRHIKADLDLAPSRALRYARGE